MMKSFNPGQRVMIDAANLTDLALTIRDIISLDKIYHVHDYHESGLLTLKETGETLRFNQQLFKPAKRHRRILKHTRVVMNTRF